MAKVVDAARVTTPSNTVWRTCIGCSQTKPMTADIDRCDDCEDAADQEALREHALSGWEHVNRYAGAIGRIEAWAVLIPNVTDSERIASIRDVLATLNAGDDKAVS
ncbi:hypothetical protein [Actinoplanes xinjiangensis]|uniref:Uncharacterized protein n=1 Tax=Actinoplanes xinjiangensis TaxID=512350 RepID=A0A316F8T1_9ACTN|nr:hypothetical protein [Actinoplanes xinjiangensis]PWK41672.1 hypothetical protein BC793_116145 [Actinoplanes xinjiangensis]GIF41922.1 hypothetical protein Axi01nite_62330 [Actinoplanes xinjiangensis]